MCTAISYKANEHYFGRNLDLEYSYKESITIAPRNYRLHFRKEGVLEHHLAIMGTAYVKDDYPLYYDAVNECGLAMAGLSFPGNAVYKSEENGKYNVTPFEFIPWVLAKCKNVREARTLIEKTNLIQLPFDKELPLTALHFMISDANESIVIEPEKEGLCIYANPIHVLTNNPPFPYHLQHLNNYMGISKKQPLNMFGRELPLQTYSRGMGGIGLPGDLSSASRFVRAAFVRANLINCGSNEENVSQMFHLLGAVEQQKGCVMVENGKYEYTIYTCCYQTEQGVYYYRTYENPTITAVSMKNVNLYENALISYPMRNDIHIQYEM